MGVGVLRGGAGVYDECSLGGFYGMAGHQLGHFEILFLVLCFSMLSIDRGISDGNPRAVSCSPGIERAVISNLQTVVRMMSIMGPGYTPVSTSSTDRTARVIPDRTGILGRSGSAA